MNRLPSHEVVDAIFFSDPDWIRCGSWLCQRDHRLPVLDADEGLVITSTKSQNHCAVGASTQSSRAAVDPLPNPHR